MTSELTAAEVTLVSAVRVGESQQAPYRRLHERAVKAARASGGLVRAELVPAAPTLQADTISLLTFAGRDDLDRWIGSATRHDILRNMTHLQEGDRSINVLAGLPGWYGSAPATPRWRQACVITIGLIPTSLITSETRVALLPHAPFVMSIAVVSLANVGILTWLVLPKLNTVFRRWIES